MHEDRSAQGVSTPGTSQKIRIKKEKKKKKKKREKKIARPGQQLRKSRMNLTDM